MILGQSWRMSSRGLVLSWGHLSRSVQNWKSPEFTLTEATPTVPNRADWCRTGNGGSNLAKSQRVVSFTVQSETSESAANEPSHISAAAADDFFFLPHPQTVCQGTFGGFAMVS